MAKFVKGQSGNPNGRPKGPSHIGICKEFAEKEGFAKLISIAKGEGYKIGTDPKTGRVIEVGPSRDLQFEALKLALAYGVGKPKEQVDLTVTEPPRIIFELARNTNKGH